MKFKIKVHPPSQETKLKWSCVVYPGKGLYRTIQDEGGKLPYNKTNFSLDELTKALQDYFWGKEIARNEIQNKDTSSFDGGTAEGI